MTVSELIETQERLKEHDPEVEVAVQRGSIWVNQPITDVALFDGMITIYGEEE